MKKIKLYDCLKKFFYNKDFKNMSSIYRKRNNSKIVKIIINWKNKWYVKLDKLNRNLIIKTTDSKIDLFTDY